MIKKKSIGSMILGLGLLSASSIAAFAGNVAIYGNMAHSQGDSPLGIYSFTPDADMVLTPVPLQLSCSKIFFARLMCLSPPSICSITPPSKPLTL